MVRLLLALLPAAGLLIGLPAGEAKDAPAETASGWVKYAKNPVLGGGLGTCFDVSVMRDPDKYRMWFSWRPHRCIALVESKNGLTWDRPANANRRLPRGSVRTKCSWKSLSAGLRLKRSRVSERM